MIATNTVRVLLADDHTIIRDGLRVLLDAQPDFEVVGEASNGTEAFDQALALRPDIVVMDVAMPGLGGAGATSRLKVALPDIKVLALSAYEDEIYVRQLLASGACGYVLKRSAAEDLVKAIHTVVSGENYIDPFVAEKIKEHLSKRTASSRNRDVLSEREATVLRLIAQGHTNKEIAAQLHLSVKTIETYKTRFRDKLDLRSRADIVRYALAQGWIGEH
ncbi:MAG TPA: response regulator transcription factor [Abditibacteriaceae bacterium]|jgi:DNA-binding NarL/FixJ family response regulator